MHLDSFVRQRAARSPDPYNPDATVEDWTSPEELPLEGFFDPASSTEEYDAVRKKVVSRELLVLWDPHADVERGDRIVQGSRVWTVEGFPSAPMNPYTGRRRHRFVRVMEAVG